MQRYGIVAGAALAVVAACARAGTSKPVATSTVDLPRSYLFRPAAITVSAGTRVTWTNHDVFTHSVRLREVGDSDQIIKPGESASYTFTRPGLYHYDCVFHTQMMKGTVEVTASAPE